MKKYLYETHLHTSEVSHCGMVPAKILVNEYTEAEYSGIIVTDHYHYDFFNQLGKKSWEYKIDQFLSGYNIAKKQGDKVGLNVLLGAEIAFKGTYDDILLYGINREFLIKYPDLYLKKAEELKKIADKENVLLYQAHPYRSYITRRYVNCVHGIEVYNGNPRHDSRNHLADRLASNYGLLKISGSDYHQQDDLASGGVILSTNPIDNKELINELKHTDESSLYMGEFFRIA